MNILITGDFYVSDRCDGKNVFNLGIRDLFCRADYRIVNLEAPMTVRNKRHKILKTGPHLHMRKEIALLLLKELKVDLVTLANNHIMDYGWPGLSNTLATLKSAGISTVGAGSNLREAARSLITEKSGIRVAVINIAENEWASATYEKPGANPLAMIDNIKQIQEAKRNSDFVIVIVHSGFDNYHLPSPLMVERYRYFAENGASVIVCHHSHCISGLEVYYGVPIFYGLGNFLFTEPSTERTWYTGLVLKLHIDGHKDIAWSITPVLQSKRTSAVRIAEDKEKEETMRDIEAFSRTILDEESFNRSWDSFLAKNKDYYLHVFSPVNMIKNKCLKYGILKIGLDRLFIRKSHYAQMLNHMRSETHAEATQSIIKRFLE